MTVRKERWGGRNDGEKGAMGRKERRGERSDGEEGVMGRRVGNDQRDWSHNQKLFLVN